MKGIIETSVYLVIFALVCFFSIDFIRINQRVSDAGEISQYIENYIEAYCGDIPDRIHTGISAVCGYVWLFFATYI